MPKPFFNNYPNIEQIIRVNHAGEYGAKRIYQGQIHFIKSLGDKELINSMLEHEQVHLDYFNEQLKGRGVRPTMLLPVWHVCGYLLGATSAIFSIKWAMLVTQNIEEVIEGHYKQQVNELTKHQELELARDIEHFMDEEILHKKIAGNYNVNSFAMAFIASAIIQKVCKMAIFLSKKI